MSEHPPDPADAPARDGGIAPSPRVLLYGRAGCHLCDEARDVVVGVAAESGAAWAEIDIDDHPDSAALVARYGELVPVVTVDGVQQGFWRIDAGRLGRALAGAAR